MRILIFSYNKVPLNSRDVVEGTGLRYWRLAKGLAAINNVEVVLAVLDKNNQTADKDEIRVIGFSDDSTAIKKLIQAERPNIIISSYWMSGIAKKILDATPSNCFFIADAYSPFYVEFFSHSSSYSADKSIMKWYPAQLDECNYILAKSDHVLVANDKQEELYRGVLSGLGFDTYKEKNKFIHIPGAIEVSNTNVSPNKLDPSRIEILWFGGMYPWFNFSDLIDLFSDQVISSIAYLRVVGGRNPMYKKTDKRYNGQYLAAYSLAKSKGLVNKSIYFEDWVSYSERLNIFASADWAISINSMGAENAYSWRIRVADLAGNDVPIMTNGGDPLGEWLIENNLAVRLKVGKGLKESFYGYIAANNLSAIYKKRLNEVHEETHIYSHVKKLIGVLKSEKTPPRIYRSKGIFLETYSDSKKIISKLENELNHSREVNKTLHGELNNAQSYINSLPKSIKEAIPYGYRIITKRLVRKLKK